MKRLPGLPFSHLTSLFESLFPKWPERIFYITLFEKEKKEYGWGAPYYLIQDDCYEQHTTKQYS